ncbi:MAG: LemA family protein [Bacteroidales bacterium]|nr:LemA family protein [Bacteroidales bacterium]
MKKLGGIIVILVILGAIVLWGVGIYNKLVSKQETVEQAVGDVQAAYQKRADQIPNVAATAKQYSDYEGDAFKNIVEARAKATSTTLDMSNMTDEQLANYQKVQDELMKTMRANLNVIVERYPDLKANTLYMNLQNSIESCENEIANARRNFNEKAKDYNQTLRRFPANIIAGMFNFDKMPYFQAAEGAEQAPNVKDLFNE